MASEDLTRVLVGSTKVRLGGREKSHQVGMEMPFVRSFAPSKVAKLDIALAPSSEISREREKM